MVYSRVAENKWYCRCGQVNAPHIGACVNCNSPAEEGRSAPFSLDEYYLIRDRKWHEQEEEEPSPLLAILTAFNVMTRTVKWKERISALSVTTGPGGGTVKLFSVADPTTVDSILAAAERLAPGRVLGEE